jgi:prepilin signal peptidase PulO-like enzyme (type II secretory pathway)
MALGTWGGFHFTVEVAILGVLLGGVFSLGMLIVRGRLISFLKRIYLFLVSIFIKELEVQLPQVDQQLTMPFALPISIAAVWALFGQPFSLLGISLW